ncbi:HIT domain-containing protein [Acephala macrosclerotiorum]|nr:HIT domain-containing protein [Acephala macrosclerotiorum]
MVQETSQDAITEDEIAGTAPPASSASSSRNAFTALMAPKRKASPSTSEPAKKPYNKNLISRRDGLDDYILHPETYSSSRVIYYDSSFVAIHDLYPKSSVHALLLPRSNHKQMHPFDAFEDPSFLSSVLEQVAKLRHIVAKELQRKYGRFSKQDIPREAVLNGKVPLPDNDELPIGRDWEKEVMAGVHARPSMNHLHVHILSIDRYSECLKHRKHYNSFATGFFVPIEDFPLTKEDVRRHPGKEGYLEEDLKCWRCGRNFGNKFARLKEHLAEEFDTWKRE